MSTTIHIINHTHWDREWFLTSVYTSQWIPNLIDRLGKLVEKTPHYKFLLDGQTLGIEDLLKFAPHYKSRGEGEAYLIALACGEPPDGYKHWSLHLLKDRIIRLEIVENILTRPFDRHSKKSSSPD